PPTRISGSSASRSGSAMTAHCTNIASTSTCRIRRADAPVARSITSQVRHEVVDRPSQCGHVHLAVPIHPERGDVRHTLQVQFSVVSSYTALISERAYPGLPEIGVQIAAMQFGNRVSAIHVAASDRDSLRTRIFDNGNDQPISRAEHARFETVGSLHD